MRYVCNLYTFSVTLVYINLYNCNTYIIYDRRQVISALQISRNFYAFYFVPTKRKFRKLFKIILRQSFVVSFQRLKFSLLPNIKAKHTAISAFKQFKRTKRENAVLKE